LLPSTDERQRGGKRRDWASPPVKSRGELVGSVVREVAVLRARWRVQRRAVVAGELVGKARRAVAIAGTRAAVAAAE